MNQIDANTIYLLIVFILPGYFALKVCNFFYKRETSITDIEITYQSLLCSGIIYLVFYTTIKYTGKELVKYVVDNPWPALFEVIGLGFLLGIMLYLLNILPTYGSKWFSKLATKVKIIGKLEKILGSIFVAEPPNVFAAIFDPKYRLSNEDGYWILWRQAGIIREGWVQLTENKETDMLLYIKEIKEIDENNNIVREFPPEYGMVVSVNLIDGFEII